MSNNFHLLPVFFASYSAIIISVSYAEPSKKAQKPNIIYMMCDELGYYELSLMGHPNFKTPNIDILAKEGVRFTQALAGSSLCAPTRCVLMTGKHSGHTSVRSNGGGTPLRAGEETIGSMLRRAGYATGGFGKWGCGGRGSTGVPEKHGFDLFVGYYDQVHAHSYYPAYIVRNSEELVLPGNVGGSSGKTYSQYVIMDEAKKFIRANKDQPFFCYLPVTPPHGLFNIPDEDPAWALFKDKEGWPDQAKRYAAMVAMIDRQVGELRSLLNELGLADNTIIFFCGDNGGQDYFRSKNHPRGFHGPNVNPKTKVTFRGHKGNLYEGGLRIPMIVHWPKKIRSGRVSDFLWYFPDVMPTVAELAGAKAPGDTDGISIVPELLGEDVAGRKQEEHEFLYWELGQQTAVRMKNWKAIQPGKNKPWELYDLDKDIEEKNSVAGQFPDVIEKMKAYAVKSHTPVKAGTFHDNDIHQKDRRAKWGTSKGSPVAKVNTVPKDGLIPHRPFKLVKVSSESKFNGKLGLKAFDGNPHTIWHSEWRDKLPDHPHELVIDLGAEHTIHGIRYLARQDKGWNGTLKDCEFYVSNSPDDFGEPALKATFTKTKKSQEVKCEPVKGRYLRLLTLSEIQDKKYATIAELGVIGE